MADQNAQVANGQQNATPNQPQVGNSNLTNVTPSANDATSQVDDGAQDTTSTLTLEQALKELAKVRKEAAEHRTARRALEAQEAERARAQMTKEERLAAELADAEKARSTIALTYQERIMQYETKLAAAELGIIDPDAAVKLLDAARIEYADDGTPKNIGKLLKELVAAKPYLLAPSNAAPRVNGSATNPATTAARTATTFTQQQINSMTPEEYAKHRAAIFQAQREGRILPN